MGKIHLVSFMDGPFRRRLSNFADMLRDFGAFDEAHLHSLRTLPADFGAAHAQFMQTTRRGFGYWIWKPVIIRETLRSAGPDDVIVYADAGYTFNLGGHRRFLEYLDVARDHDERMLSFQTVFTEAHWTKMDLAERIGRDSTAIHMRTSQLGGGLLVLGRTASNIDLLDAWAAIAVEDDYRFSDDSPSRMDNHPDFREHRHDQSISSLLRKMRGTAVTHYEVQSYQGRFDGLRDSLPFWATRLRR